MQHSFETFALFFQEMKTLDGVVTRLLSSTKLNLSRFVSSVYSIFVVILFLCSLEIVSTSFLFLTWRQQQ